MPLGIVWHILLHCAADDWYRFRFKFSSWHVYFPLGSQLCLPWGEGHHIRHPCVIYDGLSLWVENELGCEDLVDKYLPAHTRRTCWNRKEQPGHCFPTTDSCHLCQGSFSVCKASPGHCSALEFSLFDWLIWVFVPQLVVVGAYSCLCNQGSSLLKDLGGPYGVLLHFKACLIHCLICPVLEFHFELCSTLADQGPVLEELGAGIILESQFPPKWNRLMRRSVLYDCEIQGSNVHEVLS